MPIVIEVAGGTVNLPLTDELLVKAVDWTVLELQGALDAIKDMDMDMDMDSGLDALRAEAENVAKFARDLKVLNETKSEA